MWVRDILPAVREFKIFDYGIGTVYKMVNSSDEILAMVCKAIHEDVRVRASAAGR